MTKPLWLEGARRVIETLAVNTPDTTIMHLVKNGGRITPALTSVDGMNEYLGKYFMATFNPETNNVLFHGNGMAQEAAEVLAVSGYKAIDVTDFLLKKRGLDYKSAGAEQLDDLLNDPITDEELELLRLKMEE